MNDNTGLIYKVITNMLLGIIGFLAIQIYITVNDLRDRLYRVESRIFVMEKVFGHEAYKE